MLCKTDKEKKLFCQKWSSLYQKRKFLVSVPHFCTNNATRLYKISAFLSRKGRALLFTTRKYVLGFQSTRHIFFTKIQEIMLFYQNIVCKSLQIEFYLFLYLGIPSKIIIRTFINVWDSSLNSNSFLKFFINCFLILFFK